MNQFNSEHQPLPDFVRDDGFLEHIPVGFYRCREDDGLTLTTIGEGLLALLRCTREEVQTLYQGRLLSMVIREDREGIIRRSRALEEGHPFEMQYRLAPKEDSPVWVLDKGRVLTGPDGERVRWGVLVDITQEKKVQEAIGQSLERYEVIFSQTNDIVFEYDIFTDTFICLGNWEGKFGYSLSLRRYLSGDFQNKHVHEDDWEKTKQMVGQMRSGRSYMEEELRVLAVGEGYIWCRFRLSIQFNAAREPVKVFGIVMDINEERMRSRKLEEKAERDLLTKLYNKETTRQMIESCLKNIRAGDMGALLIIDIDNFKQVNDLYGHLVGDALLGQVAEGLQKLFRSGDIIGRIGGDEFIVFIRDLRAPQVAQEKALHIIRGLSKFFDPSIQDMEITCSVGVAIFPEHGDYYEGLFQRADRALYQAKNQGKNQYVLYNSKSMDSYFSDVTRTAVTAEIDSGGASRDINSEMLQHILYILYDRADLEAAVNEVIGFLGRQLNVSRVYIFENTEDGLFCYNTFEWCGEGITPEIDNIPLLSYEEDLGGMYPAAFDENGIFYCPDVTKLPERQYAILEPQGIKSMVHCAIRDGGKIKGYVGFDDCRERHLWDKRQIEVLTLISRVLSTFLLKKREQDRADRMAEGLQKLLDNQSSWVYVVDSETYVIEYKNRAAAELAPGAGKGVTCYQVLFGRTTPCEGCWAQQIDKGGSHNVEMYSPSIGRWFSIDAVPVSWKDKKAWLLAGHDITRYK